jgi:hypothetical protein
VASALDDSRVTITADAPLSIDNVNLEPVYGSANPRPAERTLYVTSPDNSGPGSLHDVAAQASAGDLIVIAVDRVNLTEPVDLSSRPVTIDGQGNHIATSACRAFDINPEIASSVTRVTNLVIDCDPDTPMQGAAFNIGDSRNKTAASVDIDSVTVNNAYATANGGAIYLNAPYVTATITNSVFNDCKAAAGAAVASAGGDMTIGWCRFNRCVTTSSTGGAVANVNSRENPLIITACRFDSCSSAATAGGAAAISVNNATQVTRVDNCQFDSNTGGRAAAVNVYCNARSAGGYTTVANCLMLNSREAPAVSVNGGASYTAPTVHLVNNILCLNPSGDITVGRGSVAGDNNLLERPIDGDNSLTRTTIDTSASQTCFAGVTDGTPDRDPATGVYPINPAGAAYAAGTPAYLVGDIDIIPAADINGLDRGGKPSLGPSEQTAFNSGLGHDAVNTPAVNVWPCPATDVIHISGEFTRYRLTSGGGLTLLTSNAPTIDATALPAGLYIITIDTPTGTVTRKITVR